MHLASLCANIAPVNANTGCDWHSGCDILRRDLASEQNAAKSNFNKCIKQNRTTRVAHSYVCSNCSDADLICILTWQTQFKRHFPSPVEFVPPASTSLWTSVQMAYFSRLLWFRWGCSPESLPRKTFAVAATGFLSLTFPTQSKN